MKPLRVISITGLAGTAGLVVYDAYSNHPDAAITEIILALILTALLLLCWSPRRKK